MKRRLASYALIAGIACLLAACGFQLRGSGLDGGAALPESWEKMFLITGNPNSEFSREVQSVFAANGIQWSGRKAANYRIALGPERFRQTNLSLNTEARVSEFELEMRAQFTVLDNKGEEVMPATDASVIRQMENNPRNVVGKTEEIRILKGEMRTELARQIMRRIGFYANTAR